MEIIRLDDLSFNHFPWSRWVYIWKKPNDAFNQCLQQAVKDSGESIMVYGQTSCGIAIHGDTILQNQTLFPWCPDTHCWANSRLISLKKEFHEWGWSPCPPQTADLHTTEPLWNDATHTVPSTFKRTPPHVPGRKSTCLTNTLASLESLLYI